MAQNWKLPYEEPQHIWPSLIKGDRLIHKKRYPFYKTSFYMYEEPQNPRQLFEELGKSEEWLEKFKYLAERGAHIEMQAAPSYMNHNMFIMFFARFPEEKWETEFLLRYGSYISSISRTK